MKSVLFWEFTQGSSSLRLIDMWGWNWQVFLKYRLKTTILHCLKSWRAQISFKLWQKPEIMKKSWNFTLNDNTLLGSDRKRVSFNTAQRQSAWLKERQGLTELRAICTVPGVCGGVFSQTFVRHTSVSSRTRAVESSYSVMTGPSI